MTTLKQTIKALAASQLGLKNQRKTVKFTGTRTLTPQQAWSQHMNNRDELRSLNIAYGLLRGKTIEEIEPTSKTPYWKSRVEQLMDKYKESIK